jgi:hypothetical protein
LKSSFIFRVGYNNFSLLNPKYQTAQKAAAKTNTKKRSQLQCTYKPFKSPIISSFIQGIENNKGKVVLQHLKADMNPNRKVHIYRDEL